MEHGTFLLLVSTCFLCRAQGPSECQEQPVSVGGTLQLQPEKPPEGWTKLRWRVRLDGGDKQWILVAEKNKTAQYSRVPVSGRADFQEETLSLRISTVRPADSGVYWAEFEDTSGSVTCQYFRVSVWDPVGQPHLEARILHQEQGWCNLSLLCTVPNTGNVSYEWSCTGDPPAALGHQPWLQLQVRGDTDPTVCHCNVSNPVSWSTASTDVVAACPPAASAGSWLYCRVKGLLSLLVLGSLVTAVAVTHGIVWRRGPPSRGAPTSAGRNPKGGGCEAAASPHPISRTRSGLQSPQQTSCF
ncbi:natural killer cell receptor 2B4-like [Balearica regulorum gibbericeps]|uniref:natural killer cell receptor 2B4-like n=1 Tax=Balearica regulorum gibbericeps TaxID=100784 RepID=UPI003F5E306F